MLEYLLNILRKSKPIKRTTKDGDRLTGDETKIFLSGKCPDCGNGLLKGPEGCGSINMYCSNKECGSRYNDMGPFGGERINDSKGAMTLIEEHKP